MMCRWRLFAALLACVSCGVGSEGDPEAGGTTTGTAASTSSSQTSGTGGCGELDCPTTSTTDPTDPTASTEPATGSSGTTGMVPDCQADASCGELVLRIATWNVLRVGTEGSAEFDALLAIVLRLDADVLCLQEVRAGEESALQAVATAAGYGHGLLAPATGPPGAEIANACMSRIPSVDEAYLWSSWISPDPDARDITRPFVRLRLHDAASNRYISVISGHLKAGDDDVDRFRRMVEAIRLGQAAASEHIEYPNNTVVALGDLNESPDPPAQTFTRLPAGLPEFYELGDDIDLPLQYEPEQPLLAADLARVEAYWEDSMQDATFIPFARRLDYIYVHNAEVLSAEVYEACEDDGIDQPPEGDVFPKAGTPLDCGLSEVASDHRPVIVELRLH